MAITISRRLFTADEYEQMVRAGILTEEDRVELIEGEIVKMTPIGSRHAACVARLNQILSEKTRGKAVQRKLEFPTEVAESSESFDRNIKGPLYAKLKVPEFWLIVLREHCIDVFRRPSAHGYEEVRRLSPEESLHPELLPDVRLAVKEILG